MWLSPHIKMDRDVERGSVGRGKIIRSLQDLKGI